MCCDAGYETKDAKMNDQINAWGKKLTDLVHTNLLGPNPKHGIFLDSCLHHCGGWGSYKIDGMVQGPAFQKCAPTLPACCGLLEGPCAGDAPPLS